MWNSFSRLLAWIENGTVGVLIIFAATMLCVQIGARALFNYSFSWAEESVRYSIIWMVFIAGSIAFRQNAHIRIDVLKQIAPENMQKPLQILITLTCMALCAMLAWHGYHLTRQIMMFGQSSPAMEAPMYLFYISIPLSSALMLIRLSETLVRLLRNQSLEYSNTPAGA
ncbi:TRAP transporter small permease [Marinobacterium sp. YM272]|uniref:TRAP transporter small permease n=1 Tax=Marinobacterium sp. YM272 TaxID=3421654 RepID=UPI003D7F756A